MLSARPLPAIAEPVRVLTACGPSSVKLLVATLRTILNGALEDGLIETNPAVRLGRLIVRTEGDADHAPDPFTAAEVAELLEAVERDWPEWHVFFLTMARTGLRVGECLSLQRDDLDLTHASVWVRRTWTRGRLGSPKGKRSRAVDLSDQLVEALRTWGSVQDAEAAVKGHAPPPWAWPALDGGPWDDRWLRWHVWRPLLRRAGLRHRGMHQLRHTYASLMIAAGAHPKYIQGQLGHASIQVTMDVYGHLFPGTFGRLVNGRHNYPQPRRNLDRNAGVARLEHQAFGWDSLSTCRSAGRARRRRPCRRRRAPPIASRAGIP